MIPGVFPQSFYPVFAHHVQVAGAWIGWSWIRVGQPEYLRKALHLNPKELRSQGGLPTHCLPNFGQTMTNPQNSYPVHSVCIAYVLIEQIVKHWKGSKWIFITKDHVNLHLSLNFSQRLVILCSYVLPSDDFHIPSPTWIPWKCRVGWRATPNTLVNSLEGTAEIIDPGGVRGGVSSLSYKGLLGASV